MLKVGSVRAALRQAENTRRWTENFEKVMGTSNSSWFTV